MTDAENLPTPATLQGMCQAMNRHPRQRKNVIVAIERAWEKFPELRLCQLISNARPVGTFEDDLFYVEDAELVKALEAYMSAPSHGTDAE